MPDRHLSKPVDAERLGALLDKRLGASERKELLEELNASQELREVLADAASALGEIEAQRSASDTDREVSRTFALRRKVRLHPRWVAAAAVLTLAIGAIVWQSRRVAPTDATDSILALLANGTSEHDVNITPAWPVTRGAEVPLSADQRATRLGALAVDLELAVTARDTNARFFALQTAALLESVPAGGPVAQIYRGLAQTEVAGGPVAPSVLRDARLASAEIAGRRAYALGVWLEAARTAAHHRDAAFFSSAATRRMLSLARTAQLPVSLVDDVAAHIRAVASPSVNDATWSELEMRLRRALALLTA